MRINETLELNMPDDIDIDKLERSKGDKGFTPGKKLEGDPT